jgi:16S rRNA (guanine527-N7)-methyltransferase
MRLGVPADPDFGTFQTALAQLEVVLTPAQFETIRHYAALVREWNGRVNLISRRDTGRLLSYHVIDSLAASQLIPRGARCCDIGTGAGLPGIPLAIARPDLKMVLVESTQKKCQFLGRATAELGLANTQLKNVRSESLEPLGCDIVLSRLTGSLRKTLKRITLHARPGGSIVLFKSPSAAEEPVGPILSKLGLVRDRATDLTLPLTSLPRRFLVLTRHGL